MTSDHGELLGENHLLDHQFSLHGALVDVPLVIHFPDRFEPGRDPYPVSTLDLHPTLLDITGIRLPQEASRSLARSLLRPGERRPRVSEYSAANTKALRSVALEHPDFDPGPFERTLRALFEGRWKLVWASDGRHEIYDLERDPEEREDRAASEASRLEVLEARLGEVMAALGGEEKTAIDVPAPSPEQIERLKSLGYGAFESEGGGLREGE